MKKSKKNEELKKIKDVRNMLFEKYPNLEKDYNNNFKEHLLEQYKLAFGSLYSIRDTVLKVASYNSAIHFFIISGLVYCISNCSFVIMIPLLCFLGALISLNWSKVDRDQNKSLECQELICKAIEEDLPCVLISTGSELKDIYCKKRLIEKLFDKIPISRLSIALFLIYLSIFVVSLIWLLLDCYNFKKFFLFLAV